MELKEAKELALSALALAVAFGIAMNGGIRGIQSLSLLTVTASLATVSLGFLLHEMGHRFVARRFGCYAEYKMWSFGLLIALLLSLFGFVFAAPGAVMIHVRPDLWGRSSEISRKREGIISLSGPAINIFLALMFLAGSLIFTGVSEILIFGASINVWLALFNMIPFPPLDGSKVFWWDRRVWAAAALPIAFLWIIL